MQELFLNVFHGPQANNPMMTGLLESTSAVSALISKSDTCRTTLLLHRVFRRNTIYLSKS
jgi:hypothetical protein